MSKESKRTYADICKDMEKLRLGADSEGDHIQADKLLVEALEMLGMKRLAKAYNRVDKWYC